jgi:hypothetical protein
MDAMEQRARELLAKVHADAGWTGLANEIRLNATFDIDYGLALAAIRAALTPPEGYVLVPVEPTDEMLGDGAESRPMLPFTPLGEWEAFEAMSGCEQGRHKARLCWSAMLAARPEVP